MSEIYINNICPFRSKSTKCTPPLIPHHHRRLIPSPLHLRNHHLKEIISHHSYRFLLLSVILSPANHAGKFFHDIFIGHIAAAKEIASDYHAIDFPFVQNKSPDKHQPPFYHIGKSIKKNNVFHCRTQPLHSNSYITDIKILQGICHVLIDLILALLIGFLNRLLALLYEFPVEAKKLLHGLFMLLGNLFSVAYLLFYLLRE